MKNSEQIEKIVITKECVVPLLDTRFIKVADLQYAPGRHYFDATRHNLDALTATLSDEEFRNMHADAVTCIVVIVCPNEQPRLLLQYEYRYPVGRFLLSPPAGLMDAADLTADAPELTAAAREIFEETGVRPGPADKLTVVNPALFSSPGMTDESNAMVCAVIHLPDLSSLNHNGAEGTECFGSFVLLDKKQAGEIYRTGRDGFGNCYSVYTWAALSHFLLMSEDDLA